MDNNEIKKKIYFAETVIGAINHVECPMLMYEEEKKWLKKLLVTTFQNLKMSLEVDKVTFDKEVIT